MKKEFKAPIVEAKELNAVNSIMADGGMLISANTGKTGLAEYEDSVTQNYKMWKGNKQ